MKILVTGGAGNVGDATARDLLAAGHEVRILDQAAPHADLREQCEIVYADLTDRLAVLRAAQGCDAIAHLAAIPNPMGNNGLQLFAPNVLGTQHVLAAAEAHDIKRVALASSTSIYGFAFQKSGDWNPKYLPMDENHPMQAEDVYALSKQCNELTAAMYTRRTGMATTCLRLCWVISFERRKQWLRRWLERAGDEPSREMWSYVERRDAARAFRLALERVESGHHIVAIVANDIWGPGAETEAGWRARIERHYPELSADLDKDFDYGRYGFWDTRRAEELLGWNSQYHWRDAFENAPKDAG